MGRAGCHLAPKHPQFCVCGSAGMDVGPGRVGGSDGQEPLSAGHQGAGCSQRSTEAVRRLFPPP